MATLKNPIELNPLQKFGQANSIYKRTSRASNPAWYQDALALDYQLHIRMDGANVSAFFYDRKEESWIEGPALTEAQLIDVDSMVAFVSEGAKYASSKGGNALGVILFIADEFALTELKPEFKDSDILHELRQTAVRNPAAVVADSSINTEQSSWRILPYFASNSESIGTAVTISRRYQPIVDALRDLGDRNDFPIIPLALSAPLIALLGVPDAVRSSVGRPSVVILQYPFFTALAFFNEHSDLLLIRTALHRGLRRPPNFRHAIAATNASLELVDPDIFVFPLGKDVDPTLVADLSITFTTSKVSSLLIPTFSVVPNWCAECLISVRTAEIDESLPGSTFATLRDQGWSFQDFLSAKTEQADLYPTKAEMKLLRGVKIIRGTAIFLGLAVVGWCVYGMFKIRESPEWAFEPSSTVLIKQRLVALNLEKRKVEHWDSLLDDRSKGWVAMESLSRLFPENSGALIRTYSYSARPEPSAGQPKSGFVKEWKITGLVKEEALEMLNSLNTREGIAAHFDEVARDTGNSAFRTDIGTRSIVVNVRTQENGGFKPAGPSDGDVVAQQNNENGFPFSFDLTITQRFEATDPLAVFTAKAP